MAASNTDRFKKSKRKFETTVGVGGILAGGTTLPLTSVTGLDTSTAVTLVVGAGTATEEVITGVVSGSNLINCVRGKEGTTDSAHSAGETVNMFFTETHWDDAMDGILVEHDQDGTHGDINADSITATTGTFTNLTIAGTATPEGWSALGATPDTVTALGNRSYSMVFNGTDLTDTLSPGMRLKMTRTVTAPTQCADLEASSSHYFNRASASVSGMTFTDDFVVSAWVKLESYTAGNIVSRFNGTSGFVMDVTASGQIRLIGYNGGAANYSYVSSYQSLPLGKWVHIAAQLDMSAFTATTTTSYVMLDGVDVPVSVARAGTNPTALIQAGNLEIGSTNGGTQPFDGKIAQVAIYSAKVTQANVLASMHQGLAGNETSLVSAYSFNNSINDLNANANNLTAQNSAAATNADSPFAQDAQGVPTGTTEYGIVTKTAFSTNTTVTVQAPEGGAIPVSGGISAVTYSTHKVPYGFISSKDKWRVFLQSLYSNGINTTVNGTWYAPIYLLTVPIGAWHLAYEIMLQSHSSAAGVRQASATLQSSAPTGYNNSMVATFYGGATATDYIMAVSRSSRIYLSTATTYTTYIANGNVGGGDTANIRGDLGQCIITADCDYL